MIDAYESKHSVIHQDDDGRFDLDTPDVELIDVLSTDVPPPVFVTADPAQRRRRAERLALASSGLTLVFFSRGWNSLSFHDRAWKLLKFWPTIVEEVGRVAQPTAFEIPPTSNKLRRLGPTCDLRPK